MTLAWGPHKVCPLTKRQPAIDAYALALMRRFNALPPASSAPGAVQPFVYQTYQAYLRRFAPAFSPLTHPADAHDRI